MLLLSRKLDDQLMLQELSYVSQSGSDILASYLWILFEQLFFTYAIGQAAYNNGNRNASPADAGLAMVQLRIHHNPSTPFYVHEKAPGQRGSLSIITLVAAIRQANAVRTQGFPVF
jgi:hypothetical protein